MSKKFFSKKSQHKFRKFFKQSDVHYLLGGLGGIALYKLMDAVTQRLPDLRSLGEEDNQFHSTIPSSEAQDGATNFE